MLLLALASATTVRAEESPEARVALDRLTSFMGGERVLSLRTLVVAGDNRRDTGHGFVAVPTRTYLAFPLSIRQEIVIGGRTLAMAASWYCPIRRYTCEGMCTMWLAPGMAVRSRSALGMADPGYDDASTAWM